MRTFPPIDVGSKIIKFLIEGFVKTFPPINWCTKIFKLLIGRITITFAPIDLVTTNIQIFDRRIFQSISSNQFGHQQYSKFWLEESSEHFLQSICAPKIFKFLIGGIIRTFPPIDLATKNIQIFDRRISQNISSNQFGHQKNSKIFKVLTGGCIKTFPPKNLGTKSI